MAKIKTGRRANDDERARARQWVELYRLASESPDGRYCLNPKDAPSEQSFIEATDPSPLLAILASFGETGTFISEQSWMQAFVYMTELKQLRAGGLTYEKAVNIMAESHHCDPRTVERRIKGTGKL